MYSNLLHVILSIKCGLNYINIYKCTNDMQFLYIFLFFSLLPCNQRLLRINFPNRKFTNPVSITNFYVYYISDSPKKHKFNGNFLKDQKTALTAWCIVPTTQNCVRMHPVSSFPMVFPVGSFKPFAALFAEEGVEPILDRELFTSTRLCFF